MGLLFRDFDRNEFCELKHLSSIVNIESNEIMKLTASEIIIKVFSTFFCAVGLLHSNKRYTIIYRLKTENDE